MSDPEKKLEGHSYDGIEELDNSLPRWWLNLLYLTIAYSVIYFIYYSLGEGPSLTQEYEHAKSDFERAQLGVGSPSKGPTESELRALLKNPTRLKIGHDVFMMKCVSCHGAQGQGGIGPNLTDEFWIHGGMMTQIASTVTDGVLDKGMPPWGPLLKKEDIHAVVAFVKSLKGSNPKGARGPQGDLLKE